METLYNHIEGQEDLVKSPETFEKHSPATNRPLYRVVQSTQMDVQRAVTAAKQCAIEWSEVPAPKRGDLLFEFAQTLEKNSDELVSIYRKETGKPEAFAKGELQGAIQQFKYFASEGRRLFGRTTTSALEQKFNFTCREPVGLSALIISANTTIANFAWKVAPCLISGNTAIIKAPEDTPLTSLTLMRLFYQQSFPSGCLNLVQGFGSLAGEYLTDNEELNLISFTGSYQVGKAINQKVSSRLTKVSLELGGNNAFVVTDSCDLDSAVDWAIKSSFSQSGQRCASSRRLIVFSSVYQEFREKFLSVVEKLKFGTENPEHIMPLINQSTLEKVSQVVQEIRQSEEVSIIQPLEAPQQGNYYPPTVIESGQDQESQFDIEIFGPVTSLYKVNTIHEAIQLTNASQYGLTAAIHTRDLDTAQFFAKHAHVGVVSVNAGTYGSEPHMPFGGRKASGNGTREPGPEALDVYTTVKNISFHFKAP